MPDNKKIPGKTYAWFKVDISEKTKLDIKEAVVKFIINKGLEENLPAANINFYVSILPEMARVDERWLRVNSENLRPSKYPAHQQYAVTIKNLLNSKV